MRENIETVTDLSDFAQFLDGLYVSERGNIVEE